MNFDYATDWYPGVFRTTPYDEDFRKFDDAETAARYLDERISDWYRTVNKDTLNQQSASDCVLAQLHGGDYSDGRHALGISLYCRAFDGTISTEAWIEEIDKRLNAERNSSVEGSRAERGNTQMEQGKKYQVTATLELVMEREGYRIFRDSDGDTVSLSHRDTVSIEPVPWEIREGDVYLQDGIAYHARRRPDNGVLVVYAAGAETALVATSSTLTEEDLIYRES